MKMRPLAALPLLALGAALSPGAWAQAPESRVVNGQRSKTCAWPSTVSVGNCTGTLVHPKVVIYAAHCGKRVRSVRFGEGRPFARSVPVETCEIYPGGSKPEQGGNHKDYAYCVLAEEVTDVPIVPVLYGCETEILEVGIKTMVVGFGATKSGASDGGVQREVEVTVDRIDEKNGKISIGGNGEGKGSCYGDSGGPLYIRLPKSLDPEESWRVVGVTSYGDDEPKCTGQAWYGMMHDAEAVPWVEEKSGIDITPCHDVDGTWNPSKDCGHFPLQPGTAHGSWDNACAGGPTGGMCSTCGPAFGSKDKGEEKSEEPESPEPSPDPSQEEEPSGQEPTPSADEPSKKESPEASTTPKPKSGSSEKDQDPNESEQNEDPQEPSPAKGCRTDSTPSNYFLILFGLEFLLGQPRRRAPHKR